MFIYYVLKVLRWFLTF